MQQRRHILVGERARRCDSYSDACGRRSYIVACTWARRRYIEAYGRDGCESASARRSG